MTHSSRRSFIKTSVVAGAGLTLSARAWGQVLGANTDIRIAIVGLNGRGRNHITEFNNLPGVRIVALCDVDTAILDKSASELPGVAKYVDFRELIAQKDIDAVSIATPNHLHSLLAIWAIQAGKDVYLEKPISHNVWEGRKVVEAAAKYNRVVQAGTQCRSSQGLIDAHAWIRAGNLGKITAVRGLCYKRRDSIGKSVGPQPVPDTVNYDLWLGPAAMTPPRRRKFHYDWHWFWETGNGDIGNQGIHQMDIARWFLGEPALAPHTMSIGGRLGYEDDGETPNTQVIIHSYPAAPLIFEVRGLPSKKGDSSMDKYRGASIGVVVHCEGGYLVIPSYTMAQAYDANGTPIKNFEGTGKHFGNFIDVVRNRKIEALRGPILEGHISSALCHVGNISHRVGHGQEPAILKEQIKGDFALSESYGRMSEHLAANDIDLGKNQTTLGMPIAVDPKKEVILGNDAANAFIKRDYRQPFVVPVVV